MALSCGTDNLIVIYDNMGNYLNTSLKTLSSSYITGIDSNERFVVMSSKSLDIYY
jgi:hypothetical protein